MTRAKSMTTLSLGLLVAGLAAGCGGSSTSAAPQSSSAGTSSAQASGSSAGSTGATPIQLGATNVLSGAIASVCKPITDGANAWFQSVNAAGGVNGHKISYNVLDDAYDPARATTNAQKLLDQHVVALVGGCGTANEKAAGLVANKAQIPFVGPFGNLQGFLDPLVPTFFATFPPYGLQDAAAVRFGLNAGGPGGVVHVSQNIPGVEQENLVAKKATEAAGGKWLGTIYADPKTTDFSPTAIKIKSLHPDYVLFSTGDGETGQVILALKNQNFTPAKMYLATTSTTDALLKNVGGSLNNHFAGISAVKMSGPAISECQQAIQKYASPDVDNLHGYYGCSVAQVVVAALKKITGDVTAASLASAMESLQNDVSAPAFGSVSFSQTNHLGVAAGTAYEVKNGAYVDSGSAPYTAP